MEPLFYNRITKPRKGGLTIAQGKRSAALGAGAITCGLKGHLKRAGASTSTIAYATFFAMKKIMCLGDSITHGDDKGGYRPYLAALLDQGKKIDFVDIYRTVSSTNELGPDGVHPQHGVYKVMAHAWFEAMKCFVN